MKDIKTDESLLAMLYAAAGRKMTAEEIEEQRLSYVMSALSSKNTLTRDQVRAMLKEMLEGAS